MTPLQTTIFPPQATEKPPISPPVPPEYFPHYRQNPVQELVFQFHSCEICSMSNPYFNDPFTNPEPDVQVQTEVVPLLVPQYHVVLLDDDDHTYDYVIELLMDVFGHSADTAYKMACEVDAAGRVIVDTTHKDRAELKRDQIHSYGADWRMARSKGSMSAIIEPAD